MKHNVKEICHSTDATEGPRFGRQMPLIDLALRLPRGAYFPESDSCGGNLFAILWA
jgi:hypothetical protein